MKNPEELVCGYVASDKLYPIVRLPQSSA